MAAKLILSMDGLVLKEITLTKERTTIGRKPHNDIQIDNLAVSGEHAAIVTILADSFLEDLGSTNGTLVNGRPIAKHFLRDGDHIDVGRHVLVYCMDDNAVIAADLVPAAAQAAAADLGKQGDAARPFVRTPREPSGGTMRRERAAANAAAERVAAGDVPSAASAEGERPDATARLPRLEGAIASVKILSGPGA